MTGRLGLSALALAALATTPRAADACSCGIGPPRVFPDGTSPVPPNVQFQIANPSIASATVTLAVTTGGASVPITITPHGDDWITVQPNAALANGTDYTLHVHPTIGGDVDVPVTASGGIIDPLPYAGIDALGLETEPIAAATGSGGCGGCVGRDANGNVSRVHFGYADPSARFAVLEVLDAAGTQVVDAYVLGATYAHDGTIGTSTCGPIAPALVAGTMQCARVVAYDAAGTRSGESTQQCATVDACAAYDFCMPTDACLSPTGGSGGADAYTDLGTSPGHSGGCCSVGDRAPAGAIALGVLGLAAMLRPRPRPRRHRARD